MEATPLKVEARAANRKGLARALRRSGKVPGILYGPNRAPTPLAVDARTLAPHVSGAERIQLFRLEWSGGGAAAEVALLKEAQRHPVTGKLIHVDFYAVDMSRKITVEVPLHFVGKAAGVELGGILQPIRRELEVRCLPAQIPESIEVDVSPLGVHDALHVSQLKLPEGIEAIYEQDFTVVTVLPPSVEQVAVATEAAAEETGAEAPASEQAAGEGSSG